MLDHEVESLMKTTRRLSVLYVEDCKEVRESISELFTHYFKHVDTAIDGVMGFQKYKAYYQENGHGYDIVITDINMPNMNGVEMIEAIYTLDDRQAIVVASAHDESQWLLQLIDLEVSHFISKPIEIDRLNKVLSRVVEIMKFKEEYRKLHSDLRLAKEEAEQSALQKSRFLANMSHEIRTPLNAITGFISLLSEEERDPKKLKYLNVVKNSSDSLLQIINDILDISKIESGKLDIESVNFNPYSDLTMVGELFQAKAAEKGVILRIQYNYNMPKILYGDILRVKQILSNLLSNAIKFTPGGSVVKCIIWYKSGKLNIRVKDYGIGIAEEKQQAIFESFVQADNSTAREYGGTGLGLAISLKLSEMLGGSLSFKSREGEGSSFLLSVEIPLGEEFKEVVPEHKNQTDTLQAHLLLVEDNETNQMFIGIILENAGLTYEVANDGLKAIEKFKQQKFDLILMDENMPNLGGIAATKEILRIEKQSGQEHTPIISLTANALKGDKERFLAAGMDDYLTKPVEPQKLMETIRDILSPTENQEGNGLKGRSV